MTGQSNSYQNRLVSLFTDKWGKLPDSTVDQIRQAVANKPLTSVKAAVDNAESVPVALRNLGVSEQKDIDANWDKAKRAWADLFGVTTEQIDSLEYLDVVYGKNAKE